MAENTKHSMRSINALDEESFVRVIGPVFEHSPWVAESTWSKKPFASVEEMHRQLCETVRSAGLEKQLKLIQAHPDLAGRLALAGKLTADSAKEQSSAGLNTLTPEELAHFQKENAAYLEKFGFPFVICARLNKKVAILEGYRIRLQNSREQEIQTALQEIFKIAELRLRDLVSG